MELLYPDLKLLHTAPVLKKNLLSLASLGLAIIKTQKKMRCLK